MSKKQNKNIITQDIQVKANEIINEGEKTSLEDKRIKFQNYVENYYNNFTCASDVLVSRLNDIDFYTSTSKDLITSAIIGIITSTIVSFFFNLDNALDKMSGIIGKLLSGIIIFIFLLWLLNLLIKKFEERKTLNNYEKLHCKEFEKEMIEKILDKRLKQANETMFVKKINYFEKAVSNCCLQPLIYAVSNCFSDKIGVLDTLLKSPFISNFISRFLSSFW